MSGGNMENAKRVRLRKKIQQERLILGILGVAVLIGSLVYWISRDNEQYLPYTGLAPDGIIEGIPGDPLQKPSTVAVGIANEIYIGDQGMGKVMVYDEEGRYLLSLGGPGSGLAEIPTPVSLAVAPNGNIYVADAGKGAIVQFARDGSYLGRIDHAGKQPLKAAAIATDSQGNLFVFDKASKSVKVYNSQMQFVKDLDKETTAAFSDIQGMKVDEERGLLTLIDSNEAKLYNLSLDGKSQVSLDLPEEIKKPVDVVYNALADQYFVIDQERNCVVVIDAKGLYLGEFGNGGGALGKLKQPAGIVKKVDGSTYIADSGNKRVVIYRKSK